MSQGHAARSRQKEARSAHATRGMRRSPARQVAWLVGEAWQQTAPARAMRGDIDTGDDGFEDLRRLVVVLSAGM